MPGKGTCMLKRFWNDFSWYLFFSVFQSLAFYCECIWLWDKKKEEKKEKKKAREKRKSLKVKQRKIKLYKLDATFKIVSVSNKRETNLCKKIQSKKRLSRETCPIMVRVRVWKYLYVKGKIKIDSQKGMAKSNKLEINHAHLTYQKK